MLKIVRRQVKLIGRLYEVWFFMQGLRPCTPNGRAGGARYHIKQRTDARSPTKDD